MSNVRVPPIPEDLMAYLSEVFPDRLPHPETPEMEVRLLMGQQQVIRHLRTKYDAQNKTILKS